MTNAERLYKSNIYDLLCRMNKRITGVGCECVLMALDEDAEIGAACYGRCAECIARWLGEEERKCP